MKPKRTYYFDRHVSDVVLRLLLVSIFIPCTIVSWFCWYRFDATLEGLFERNISLKVQLILKRTDKTGFSATTLFQEIDAKRRNDGLGVLSYPKYLVEAGLDTKDPDLTAVRLYIFSHRLAMYAIGAFFTGLALLLLYIIVVSYGSGTSRWRLHRFIFSFFNTDFESIAPKVGVDQLTPSQRAIFDICFRRALASEAGEFLFVANEYYRALHPRGEVDQGKMVELYGDFHDLVERLHRFSFIRGTERVTREYCLVTPVKGKVTMVDKEIDGVAKTFYKAGVFQIHPRLFAALKVDYKFVEKLDPVVFAVDHHTHPFAYSIYHVIFSYRLGIEKGRNRELIQHGKLTLPLVRLLEESNLELPEDNLRDFLADFHADLNHLVNRKVIDAWEVRDQGIPLARDWYESIQSFSYDPDRREYKTGLEIVSNKVYCFEVGIPSYPELPTGTPVRRLPPAPEAPKETESASEPKPKVKKKVKKKPKTKKVVKKKKKAPKEPTEAKEEDKSAKEQTNEPNEPKKPVEESAEKE